MADEQKLAEAQAQINQGMALQAEGMAKIKQACDMLKGVDKDLFSANVSMNKP